MDKTIEFLVKKCCGRAASGQCVWHRWRLFSESNIVSMIRSLASLACVALLVACTGPTASVSPPSGHGTAPALGLDRSAAALHAQGRYLLSEVAALPITERHPVSAADRADANAAAARAMSAARQVASASGADVSEVDILDSSPDAQGNTGVEFQYTDGSAIIGSLVDGNTVRQDNPDGSYFLTRFDASHAADGNVLVTATAVSQPAGTRPASSARIAQGQRRASGAECAAVGIAVGAMAIPIARAVFKRVGQTTGAIVLGSEFPPGAVVGYLAGGMVGDWFGNRVAGPLIGYGAARLCQAMQSTPTPSPSPIPQQGGGHGGKQTIGQGS